MCPLRAQVSGNPVSKSSLVGLSQIYLKVFVTSSSDGRRSDPGIWHINVTVVPCRVVNALFVSELLFPVILRPAPELTYGSCMVLYQ